LFGVTLVIDGSLVILMLQSASMSLYHFKEKDVIEVLLVYNSLQFVYILGGGKTFSLETIEELYEYFNLAKKPQPYLHHLLFKRQKKKKLTKFIFQKMNKLLLLRLTLDRLVLLMLRVLLHGLEILKIVQLWQV
jgi:hypothetical protein